MINIDGKQLVAGALLKFGYIKERDINFFAYELEKDKNINVNDVNLGDLKKYITSNSEHLNEENKLDFSKLIDYEGQKISLYEYLNKIQGHTVKDFFDNISIEELVLRKSKVYEIPYEDRQSYFGKEELKKLEELIDNYSLVLSWYESYLYDDYLVVKLSNIGKGTLFKIDQQERLQIFKTSLQQNGYDVSLIDDFLRVQDLEQPTKSILDIDNFKYFCCAYDRCITNEEKSKTLIKK